jgi:hypothetical protein
VVENEIEAVFLGFPGVKEEGPDECIQLKANC